MLDLNAWARGRRGYDAIEEGLSLDGKEEYDEEKGLRPTGAPGRWMRLAGGLKTSVIVLGWYGSNIGILILNKYLLSYAGYRYPIFLTMIHMLACTIFSVVFVKGFHMVKPQPIQSRGQFFKILALSLIFCLSVVCGNVSLKYLPVSFNQAIGATGPAFTAFFSILMTWKRESLQVYISLVPVVLGIVIASGGEPLFNLFGFTMVLTSTAGRACKSVLQGILLSSDSEKLNSMNLLMYMAPISALALLPVSILTEGNVLSITLKKGAETPFVYALLAANASMAYAVNLMNFVVTKHTSALTLQVLGNAKAALAVVISVAVFWNPVTLQGILGFGMTLAGVVLYSNARRRSKHK